MSDSHVIKSVEWLVKHQNGDGGWGMYDHDDSRIVTTAEGVVALTIAGVKSNSLDRGIDYLVTSANNPSWCKYIRHHAWIIYALNRAGKAELIPSRCFQYVYRSHHNGAWCQEPGGFPSLFTTFLATRALFVSGKSIRLVAKARQWIAYQTKGEYWTFDGSHPSYTATSYAVLALMTQENWRASTYEKLINNAIQFLINGQEANWPIEREPNVAGDLVYNFHHCSISWVIMALITAGVSIYHPAIIEAINSLYNKYYCNTTGGWSEEEEHRPSVFATSHAIAAIESLHKAFSVENFLSNSWNEVSLMNSAQKNSKNIFIVHGHDNATKFEVARFLEKLGCNPVLLEEQVESGINTIFQKLMDHAGKVSYAIVLLTPDDLAEDETGTKAARARQNVLFELGLFIGKLGVDRVCLLKKGDVDIPTDISGVLYLNLNDGGWELSLAQKINKAELPIDVRKLL